MAMEPLLPILLSLFTAATVAATPYHQGIITTVVPFEPNQLRALQTMNIPISNTYPCLDQAVLCDNSSPRHIISLRLHNCSHYLSVSPTPLKNLSSELTTLELINCHFNLQSNSTPLLLILENLKNLTSLTISYSNLNESLPDKWDNLNFTNIDLSNNQLYGEIPQSLKNLVCLKTLSLASNSLCGDIPRFTRDMKGLRYLNLENNKFKNDDTCDKDNSKPTGAVLVMAYILSMWIIFILIVMLFSNCW